MDQEKMEGGIRDRIWNAKTQWWSSVLVASGLMTAILAGQRNIFASLILILWLFVAITVVYLFLKVKKQYDSMQDIHPDDTVSEEVVAKNLKNANQAHKQVKFIERKILDPSTLFALIATFLYFICSLALPPTSKLRLLDYSTVVNDKSNGYVGKTVQWRGVIAGLSQLDGIKFWVVDKNHTSFDDSYHDWFWAVPDDLLSLDTEQTHGAWVTYTLRRFGNIDANTIDSGHDIFLVTGELDENDCTYYDITPATTAPCIPQVILKRIEKTGKLDTNYKFNP